MLGSLLRRRARTLTNTIGHWTGYEWARNAAFGSAGFGLLFGLHYGFFRLLKYLAAVELIGLLLTWKLTAMLLLMTFSMVVVSSLLTALTTLFYSSDLKFLLNAPISQRTVFLDKSLESAVLASWMIGLILVPYIAALMRVLSLGRGYLLAFSAFRFRHFCSWLPFCGIGFTLLLLYLFPSSRTATWSGCSRACRSRSSTDWCALPSPRNWSARTRLRSSPST